MYDSAILGYFYLRHTFHESAGVIGQGSCAIACVWNNIGYFPGKGVSHKTATL